MRRLVLGPLLLALACSACSENRLASARSEAVGYFAKHVPRGDPGWANLLGYLHRRFGLEVRSAAGLPLHEVPDDQTRPDLAVLYRRLVDPSARVDKQAIADLPTAIDRITASALHCDRIALPPDWLEILRQATALGGYALTHAALAGEWTLENRCLSWADLGALQAEQVEALLRIAGERDGLRDRFAASDDVWLEALAMLYYLRAGVRVEPSWVDTVLSAQRADGGWAAHPESDTSDPHATALALWIVLENLEPDAEPITWIPQP